MDGLLELRKIPYTGNIVHRDLGVFEQLGTVMRCFLHCAPRPSEFLPH